MTKSSKSFHEPDAKTYTKPKISVSADPKSRPKRSELKSVERPIKEYRSEQTIDRSGSLGKPMKAFDYEPVKSRDFDRHDWSNCHGDYFQPVTRQSPSRVSFMSGGKQTLQQRRNSTSFSTITIGGDADYIGVTRSGQRHGVITASALMDLRTSMR